MKSWNNFVQNSTKILKLNVSILLFVDEKVRKFSENHHPVADSMLTSDKINIVLEELDELKETADSLDKV